MKAGRDESVVDTYNNDLQRRLYRVLAESDVAITLGQLLSGDAGWNLDNFIHINQGKH